MATAWDSDCGHCCAVLALAHYRLARYDEAIAAAEHAGDLIGMHSKVPHPVALATLAMSHFQLGNAARARAALETLNATLSWDHLDFNLALDIRSEVRSLIEPSVPEP